MSTALDAGHAAADAALRNAGITWAEQAMNLLEQYKQKADGKFLCEDVRVFAENNGLSKPPDSRAWGGVIKRAQRLGIVVPAGYAMTRHPSCHAGVKTAWQFAN